MTNIVLTPDSILPYGELEILVTPTGGKSLTIFRETNLIMDTGKAYVLSSIHSNTFTPDILATFKVGTGGTITPGGSDVKTPQPNMTDLYAPITPAGNYNSSLPSPAVSLDGKSVTFSFSIADAELTGQNINEAGMFHQSGALFNIKTFPSIAKSGGFSITFLWTVRYK